MLLNIMLEGVMCRTVLYSRGTIFTRSDQFACFAVDMDIIRIEFQTLYYVGYAIRSILNILKKFTL